MKDRYRVELSLNIWCDSDEKAKEIAENICNEQRKKYDNSCHILNIYDSPFGRIEGENIR